MNSGDSEDSDALLCGMGLGESADTDRAGPSGKPLPFPTCCEQPLAELIAEGWTRQLVERAETAQQSAQAFERAGYETRVAPLCFPGQETCEICVQAGIEQYRAVYTRRAG